MGDAGAWNARKHEAALELESLGSEALARFAGLSSEQLGWTPAAGRWGVAQCFAHLIATQTPYIEQFAQLTAKGHNPTTWERLSPFSGFFGRMVINGVRPENTNKVKTLKKFDPVAGSGDVTVIPRFADNQNALAAAVRHLPSEPDFGRKVITSRLSSFVTYSLDDCLTLLVLHGRRHYRQAEEVTRSPGFPAG